jgi:hypothetical protein
MARVKRIVTGIGAVVSQIVDNREEDGLQPDGPGPLACVRPFYDSSSPSQCDALLTTLQYTYAPVGLRRKHHLS